MFLKIFWSLLFVVSLVCQSNAEEDIAIQRYQRALNLISTRYYRTLTINELVDASIKGMISELLDPHTIYYPNAAAYENFRSKTEGNYTGIGIDLAFYENQYYIYQVFSSSPAAAAGLMMGDQIISVDSIPVKGKNLKEINSLLRGDSNIPVNLTIARAIYTDTLQIVQKQMNINRKLIQLPAAPHSRIWVDARGKRNMYIELKEFSLTSVSEISRLLRSHESDLAPTSLILDVRDNGGGYLNSSIDIASFFIEEETLMLTTRNLYPHAYQEWWSSGSYQFDGKLVLLLDDQSASATEILAGILQDFDRAVLIGQKTFGKGSVQNIQILPGPGSSRLKYTTSHYFLPTGRSIHRIKPQIHKTDNGPLPPTNYTADQSSQISIINFEDTNAVSYLKKRFYTRSGRVVFGGDGITPDMIIPKPRMAHFMEYLIDNGWLFRFAAQYRAVWEKQHKKAIDAADWVAFKKFLKENKFSYRHPTDSLFRKIDSLISFERVAPFDSASYAALKRSVKSDYSFYMQANRDFIMGALEGEFNHFTKTDDEWYYYKLNQDSIFLKAMEVVNAPNEIFSKYLAP